MTVALVPADTFDLDAAGDPAAYVALACERAKTWLANALEHGDIEQIVELKSQAEAIRIYTQQKQLGKDAEISAAEIVRRAERCLAIAVKKGQESGEINGPRPPGKIVPTGTISPAELFGSARARDESSVMAKAGDDDFEAAIDEAKAEKNLSRRNVVRKVKKAPPTTNDRHALLHRTRRPNANRIVGETAIALEGLVMGLDLLEVDQLDRDQIATWATSLSNSLRSLNRLTKQLKEMARDEG